MTYSIRTDFLDDDSADLLYAAHPRLREAPGGYCPTCLKRGTYRWRGEERPCDCQLQVQLHKHYLDSGIGITYQRLDWADFEGDDSLVAQVSKYLFNHERYLDRGTGLLFSGGYGTGKTMLANLILKELVKLGRSCYATTFAGCIEQFTATWGNDKAKTRFADKFMRSEVLLLDDLGRSLRAKNNLPESTFDYILRTRVQEGRPVILTTNMDIEELRDGYGSGPLSLLTETSIYHEFKGDDFRPKANLRTRAEIDAEEVRPIF